MFLKTVAPLPLVLIDDQTLQLRLHQKKPPDRIYLPYQADSAGLDGDPVSR
ncbi:hypothetical protein [Enterococcus sp. CSURQ0835]|uniref:hypothetical protein n=1 Tax=Enterococcus sp. CSURQ0835 TaxID=2681394 RepID=UPI00135791F5|nr:hypothetical protein [Enterococcus sp. CSURQ0835]